MTIAQQIQEISGKRRLKGWEPVPTTSKFTGDPGVRKVIQRLCLLKDLEIQVGNWINVGLDSQDEQAIREALMQNISDEERHYRTVQALESYVEPLLNKGEQLMAENIVRTWADLPQTFVSAYALEMGVFFSILPWMAKHGSPYIQQASNWISDDEAVHVRIHLLCSKLKGQKLSIDHLQAIKNTIHFLFRQVYGDEEIFVIVDRAISRLKTGKDVTMRDESVLATPAFFEQRTREDIKY